MDYTRACSSVSVSPLLWARLQHAPLSRSEPGFDPWSGQVSWVRFFWDFSSPVRQMSGSFRPPRSPNIIWPSLSSSLIIHYEHQWREMLARPKTLNIHTYVSVRCWATWLRYANPPSSLNICQTACRSRQFSVMFIINYALGTVTLVGGVIYISRLWWRSLGAQLFPSVDTRLILYGGTSRW